MGSEGKQVRNGKAFEYAIATQYYAYLQGRGNAVDIVENKAFAVARKYFEGFPQQEQDRFNKAAYNTIDTMVKIEPGLTAQNDDKDILCISLNEDQAGREGDVRDVIFQRTRFPWEIGFSAKNNNDAVKHSRLGRKLDFGQVWLDKPCSSDYWTETKPVFDYLEENAVKRYNWNDLGQDKTGKVYVPLLNAFKKELLKINAGNAHIPEKTDSLPYR